MINTHASHCAEIERCNQRGARMLSIVDLIEAGTLSPELAAYALSAISRGASFMIGALPGGAGKTTVMGALLNFVPPGVELLAADGLSAMAAGRANRPRRCFVCHEIGPAPYYASCGQPMMWGERTTVLTPCAWMKATISRAAFSLCNTPALVFKRYVG